MSVNLNDLFERLAQVEQRIEAIEKSTSETVRENVSVVAPLKVVDNNGHTVLEVCSGVHRNRLCIFDSEQKVAAEVGADGLGGYVRLNNTDGKMVAYLSVESSGGKLHISDNEDKGGVVLYTDDIDGGGINILHRAGRYSITLYSEPGGGNIEVYNEMDESVVNIASTASGGRIKLKDEAGTTTIDLP